MENINIALQTVIAFCAFFSFQFLVFMAVLKLSLKPLKEGQEKIEGDIISAVNKKMDEQWKILNERTLEDFRKLLLSSLEEIKNKEKSDS